MLRRQGEEGWRSSVSAGANGLTVAVVFSVVDARELRSVGCRSSVVIVWFCFSWAGGCGLCGHGFLCQVRE